MQIEVLGTGCRKCQLLFQAAATALERTGRTASLAKVEDLQRIVAYGVMTTPALVIDGRVVAAGRVPTASEIAALIETAGEVPAAGSPATR